MKSLKNHRMVFTALLFVFMCGSITAQELKPVQLPAPQLNTGVNLMQALQDRESARTFVDKPLPMQELSNLLFAAYGINRPENGKRTAPSAMNWQEYDIYVVMKEGAFVWDGAKNILNPVASGDLREATGVQSFVKSASVNLVYVADLKKVSRADSDDSKLFVYTDCGFIAQNAYLYCASAGLAARVRGLVDREKLSKLLNLRPEQKIVLCHSIGYDK